MVNVYQVKNPCGSQKFGRDRKLSWKQEAHRALCSNNQMENCGVSRGWACHGKTQLLEKVLFQKKVPFCCDNRVQQFKSISEKSIPDLSLNSHC